MKQYVGFIRMSGALFATIAIPFSGDLAFAAGKKSSNPGTNTPVTSTPRPVRAAILQPVGTKAFQLPNGSTVNLGADLLAMLNTVVSNTNSFSAGDPYAEDPCNSHIEIRAAVSTLELDIASVGVSVGYTPNGALGPISGINGKVGVQIGSIGMDFSVWQCDNGKCASVAAATASHVTAGVDLSLEIDFGVVKTGPDLLFNTSLGAILRKVMTAGMNTLSAAERLNELPWQARVREYIPSTGILFFDAGTQSRLAAYQNFTVFAPTDSTPAGVCHVYRPVAHIHSTAVEAVSSTAQVDEILDPRGIVDGDVVMIRTPSSR